MEKDTICIRRPIKLKKEQKARLQMEVIHAGKRAALRRNEKREIIRKEDLKNHKMLAIQIMPDWPEDVKCSLLGLFETGIDEEKNTMKGIRVLINCRGNEFIEYTFDLDKYGTNWVAYNK